MNPRPYFALLALLTILCVNPFLMMAFVVLSFCDYLYYEEKLEELRKRLDVLEGK